MQPFSLNEVSFLVEYLCVLLGKLLLAVSFVDEVFLATRYPAVGDRL